MGRSFVLKRNKNRYILKEKDTQDSARPEVDIVLRKYILLWPFYAVRDAIQFLRADKRQRSILWYVPEFCQKCPVMAMCRDEKNNWKCRAGCLVKREEKADGTVG